MSRKEWISIVILAAVLIFAIYRYQNRLFTETRTRVMMGTLVEVSLTSPQKDILAVMDSTFNLINYYEKMFSYYDEEGELRRVNESKEDSVSVSEEFYEILSTAEKFHGNTSGKYDVTVAPLSKLWSGGRTSIPPADSIEAAMALVGFDKLEYGRGYIKRPEGVRIDLGSIAKGYIIEKAAKFAESKDIAYGHINAGGDIRLFGNYPNEQKIGIRHPRDPEKMIATLRISNKAIVTSGDYERFFEVEGERFHHIINPLTGYPAENVFSVTIIADDAVIADALSTAVFLMEPEEAVELIRGTSGAEGIIYYPEKDEILSLRTEGSSVYLVEEQK